MRLALADIEHIAFKAFTGAGVQEDQARNVARIVSWCEGTGRANFGLLRVPVHVKRLRAGVLNPVASMRIEKKSPSVIQLDGDNGFGYHVAAVGMTLAIEAAYHTGIGVCAVRNSNFFGAGAYYVNQAADNGMVGLAMSNSFPKVAAHGGFLPVLGTNPFAFGAPRGNGRHLLFDMATSGLAGSTVREHIEKGLPLPEGLAVDGQGLPITDPAKAEMGALLPFAGAKGFGLSLMVEILAGVITGAGVMSGVGSMYKDFARGGDNGHFLAAIDVRRFMPQDEYFARLEAMLAMMRASNPAGGVVYPGEIRWETLAASERDGVEIPDALLADIEALSNA